MLSSADLVEVDCHVDNEQTLHYEHEHTLAKRWHVRGPSGFSANPKRKNIRAARKHAHVSRARRDYACPSAWVVRAVVGAVAATFVCARASGMGMRAWGRGWGLRAGIAGRRAGIAGMGTGGLSKT